MLSLYLSNGQSPNLTPLVPHLLCRRRPCRCRVVLAVVVPVAVESPAYTWKSIELGKILQKRRINIACLQETRCGGTRAREVNGYKLWYAGGAGGTRGKNGVGILLERDLRELVVDVKRVNDTLIVIKLVVGGLTLSVASHTHHKRDWGEEVKRQFWEDLDEVVRGILHTDKIFIGCDVNGHIHEMTKGYDDVHEGFYYGVSNEGGSSLLDFSRAFDLVLANSCFQKREDHFVTFQSVVANTQIAYLLYKMRDRDFALIARLFRIWELGRSCGDASSMWTSTTNCIREAARAVLGVTKGFSRGRKGDWWINGEVQRKVEAKKDAYMKLVENADKEERRKLRE
uniref:Craniofacial development protein 2-like n=1 Tax=Nicotiana tabacum TaxID=4097 RepID=A0A1S4ARB8_TOBAC|nr:PREDICTED: uncharacterized protein LOC107800386 [Nicotiana tabacum]